MATPVIKSNKKTLSHTSGNFKPIRSSRDDDTVQNSEPPANESFTRQTSQESQILPNYHRRTSRNNDRPFNRQSSNDSKHENTDQKPPIDVSRPPSSHGYSLDQRRSSVARVRELREVLSGMATPTPEDGEPAIMGSQRARHLVANQQILVSRLQDLRHELDSMDNEVSRVRNDIINSRR